MKNNKKIVLGSVVALALSVGVVAPNLTKADNNPSSQTVPGVTLNSNTTSVSNENDKNDINKAPAAKDTKLNEVSSLAAKDTKLNEVSPLAAKDTKLNENSPLALKENGQAQPDAKAKKAEKLKTAKTNAKETIKNLDLSGVQKSNFNGKVEAANSVKEVKNIEAEAKELVNYIFEAKMSLPELKEGQDINKIMDAFNKAVDKAQVDKVKKSVVDPEGFKEDQELEDLKAQIKEEIEKLDLSQVQKDHFKSLVDKAEDKKSVNKVKKDAEELLDAIVDAKMNKLSPTDDPEFIQKAMEALDKALTKEDVNKAVEKTNKEVKDEKEESLKALKTQIKEEIEKLDLSQVQKDHFKSLVDKAEDEKSVNQVKKDAQELLDAIIDAKFNKLAPTDDEAIMKKTLEMLDNALTKSDVKNIINKINKEVKAAKDLKDAKERAIKELKEAGITGKIYFDQINKAKTIEGVETLKNEILEAHKKGSGKENPGKEDPKVKPEDPKDPKVKPENPKNPEKPEEKVQSSKGKALVNEKPEYDMSKLPKDKKTTKPEAKKPGKKVEDKKKAQPAKAVVKKVNNVNTGVAGLTGVVATLATSALALFKSKRK